MGNSKFHHGQNKIPKLSMSQDSIYNQNIDNAFQESDEFQRQLKIFLNMIIQDLKVPTEKSLNLI